MKFKLKRRQRRELIRISEYLVSGGAYFWSGYAMFFVLDHWVGLSLWWAKLLANVTGWTVNYVLQRYWVFSSPSLKKRQLAVTERYMGLTLFNFMLDYVIVAGLNSVGISPYIGQFVSAGFFTFWNYLWYKLYVFARPHVSKKHKAHRKPHNHPGFSRKRLVPKGASR